MSNNLYCEAKRIKEEEYTNRYREEIRANLKAIKAWLERLDSREHQTLLCWEHGGRDETLKRSPKTFCHGNLAIKLVEKFRPACHDGQDVINYPMPFCRECLTKVIPAPITEGYDDAHYCPKCRTWTKSMLYPNQPECQVKEKRLTPIR